MNSNNASVHESQDFFKENSEKKSKVEEQKLDSNLSIKLNKKEEEYTVFSDGSKYKGDLKDGKPHGKGIIEYVGAVYDGQFVSGKAEGQGKSIKNKKSFTFSIV